MDISSDFLIENKMADMIDAFASTTELYSVVLDINGHILVEPSGPNPYLGEFYELVRNPKYKSLYGEIVSCIVDTKQSMYSEIDDGNPDSRFAAAPIFVNGSFLGTWILYAHTSAQNQKLFKAFDNFSRIANSLSDIISKIHNSAVFQKEKKSIKKELEFERGAKEIMENIMRLFSKGDRGRIEDVYDQVGRLLDVDFIVYYKDDKEKAGHMILSDYWSKNGKSEEEKKKFAWEHDHLDLEMQNMIKQDCLIIDKKNMTNQLRVETFEGNAKAVMVFPVNIFGNYRGRLIFIENTKERIWSEDEIKFAREITVMYSRDLMITKLVKDSIGVPSTISRVFTDAPFIVVVRNYDTGEVLFSNKMLDEKVGYDLKGKDGYFILPRVTDEYNGLDTENIYGKNLGGIRYKRFIDVLDGIYDVTEVTFKWNRTTKATILIMVPEAS